MQGSLILTYTCRFIIIHRLVSLIYLYFRTGRCGW